MQVNTREKIPINKICYWLIIFMLALSLLFSFAFIKGVTYADSKYSDVLSDLQKDSDFDISDYPTKNNDYSVSLIQIAESVDNQLFIYAYQPSQDKIQVTSINISTAINDSLNYQNYKLTLINSSGTLYKYIVNDFVVKQDALRYYDISSIFRKADSTIDTITDENDNTKTEIAYSVGKLYTASTVEGVVSYTCLDSEIITITDKYVGFLRYANGFKLYLTSCDSHYVAFSTDKPIDRLMEADVYYIARSVRSHINLTGEHVDEYGEELDNYIKLDYTDVADNSADGVFFRKYSWNRIESVSEFTSKESLSAETKNALSNKDWVLRFAETDYKHAEGITGVDTAVYTQVTDVTILRLKFETDGVVYNLGVVDNKQTGSFFPDNFVELDIWQKIVILLTCLIVLVVLMPLLPLILKAIVFIFTMIIKAIVAVVTFPFKIFKK